jgi:hypothetical protein
MWAVEEGTGGGGASLDDRCPTGRPGEVAENEPLRGLSSTASVMMAEGLDEVRMPSFRLYCEAPV